MVKKDELNNENTLLFVSLGLLSLVAIVAIIYMSNDKDIFSGNAVPLRINEGQTRCVKILFGIVGTKVEVYRGGSWVFQERCLEGCSEGRCNPCTPRTEYKCADAYFEQKNTLDANCKATISYTNCPAGCNSKTGRCAPNPPPLPCVDSDNGIKEDVPGECSVGSGTPIFDTCIKVQRLKEAYCNSGKCAFIEKTCSGAKKCHVNSRGIAYCS